MARGRPPLGTRLLDKVAGAAAAKERLRLIIETLAGQRSVKDASQCLGVTERRFYDLRTEFLERSLEELVPRPAGRPTRSPAAADQRVAELEAEVRDLRVSLQAASVREEIALTMPHLLQRAAGKKTRRRRRRAAAGVKTPT